MKETKVWKFETFIFDALEFTKKVCALETTREEFSPLKNKEGEKSPETVERDMSNLFKKWFKNAGIDIPENIKVEISPLFAIDENEFRKKIKNLEINTDRDIYLE